MKLCRVFQFLLLSVISVMGQVVTWTEKHSECRGIVSSNEKIANIMCTDAPYYRYVIKALKNPKSEYHRSILQAIVDLYSELEKERAPQEIEIARNNEKVKLLVHPVSFSLPEENIVRTVPPKKKPFGRVIPGLSSTYFSLQEERLYFEDMEHSLFAITYKKGGWDCLRHIEILAAGAVPLFMGIKHCPPRALVAHPKHLYSLLLHQPGLDLKGTRSDRMTMTFSRMHLDLGHFDPELYTTLNLALLQYTRNVFSTRGMAAYVLDTMFKHSEGYLKTAPPHSVLYLTHQDHDMDKGDYLTDFTLHGLKTLLGDTQVVDFPRRDALYKTQQEFNHTKYIDRRKDLYGLGFTWALKLDVLDETNMREYEVVRKNIEGRRYETVILGSGHRDGWAAKLHFWDLVCKHYHPLEVGFVEGADYHLPKKTLDKYSPCAGHIFSREGYEQQ